nr:hypothetical protein [Tanacetum cinerariifolium]
MEKHEKVKVNSQRRSQKRRNVKWANPYPSNGPDIDQNENRILRSSTMAIANKLKAIIQKDELTIVDLQGARLERPKQQYQNDMELEYHVSQLNGAVLVEANWNSDEDDVSKPISFNRHMYKNIKPHPSFYNNDLYYIVCLSIENKCTTSITKHYATRYQIQGIEDMIPDRWSKETYGYIFETLNVMIQNRVEDIQLRMESYQQTCNLTKPMIFFKRINQRIPFIMYETHIGVVYLNQHNIKSFMKLSEVKALCDGTLIKIRENLVDMVKREKLGTSNKWLKGRDWTNMDINKSSEMVDKIDKTLTCRDQLRRLEEYVRGRPKIVNP